MKVSGKRLAAAALSMALVLSLSSCGKGTETKKPENSPSPAPVVTPTPEPTPTPAADPEEAVRTYWSEDQLTQAWGPNQVVEHLFFHPVSPIPSGPSMTANASQSEKEGLDDWMVTVDEFNKFSTASMSAVIFWSICATYGAEYTQ